jgi:holo-[acyl-carrier protein] synthase
MIVGIGCDIVDHKLTQLLKWETDFNLLRRIFSNKELDLYSKEKSLRFLAGRFAAKEALLKCLGTGMQDGMALTEIETLTSESGQPQILITGEVKRISSQLSVDSWHISITHSTYYSLAFVVAERLANIGLSHTK